MDIESEPPAPDDSPDWRYSLLQRLVNGTLPSDQAEARRVARCAKTFLLDGGCTCAAPRAFLCATSPIRRVSGSLRTFRQGFYWPTAMADSTEIV